MYTTKYPPHTYFSRISEVFNVKYSLTPFKDNLLSLIGLEFDSFVVKKMGRLKLRYYNYKIVDENRLKQFDPNYKNNEERLSHF